MATVMDISIKLRTPSQAIYAAGSVPSIKQTANSDLPIRFSTVSRAGNVADSQFSQNKFPTHVTDNLMNSNNEPFSIQNQSIVRTLIRT